MRLKSFVLCLIFCVSFACRDAVQPGNPSSNDDPFSPPKNVDARYPFRIVRVEPNPVATIWGSRYTRETIWLQNYGTTTASFSGWSLKTNLGATILIDWRFISKLLEPNKKTAFNEFTFRQGSNVLSDNGDTVRLFAADNTLVQTVVYSNAAHQYALEVFSPRTTVLRIYSVIPNPSGPDDDNEIITVENMTPDIVTSLNGWRFRSKGGQIRNLTDALPRNQQYGYLPVTYRYAGAAWLNNEGDYVELLAPDGTVVNRAEWGKVNESEVIYP